MPLNTCSVGKIGSLLQIFQAIHHGELDRFNGLINSLYWQTASEGFKGLFLMSKVTIVIGIICVTLSAGCALMGDRGQPRQSENFPSFQPKFLLPHGSDIQDDSYSRGDANGGVNITAFAERSPAENADFYLKALPLYGWSLASQKVDNAISLQFVKGNQLMRIHITYRGEGLENKSLITIVSER